MYKYIASVPHVINFLVTGATLILITILNYFLFLTTKLVVYYGTMSIKEIDETNGCRVYLKNIRDIIDEYER